MFLFLFKHLCPNIDNFAQTYQLKFDTAPRKDTPKNNKIKQALSDLTIGLVLLLIWMDQNLGCCNAQLPANTKFHHSPQPSLKPTILVHHCSLHFVNVSKPIFSIPNALLSKTMHFSWHLQLLLDLYVLDFMV